VFGYPAGLPQIFRAAGCDRFVTQKLSWNKQNRFPHSTFQWQGLDGSRVLTHFPPVDTYNATVIGEELVFAEQRFKEHGWSEWSLMPFGHGNGGGGPTREMLERARRFADLGGAPRVTQGTPGEFFGHVEAEIAAGAPVPVWDGELYFEMHRGTLTSQARTKVGNRHCERLLREAELWWATGGALPPQVAAELDALWKEVLVQQFHDIIPGSSITWVHADAEAVHERVATRLEALIAEALALLAPAVPALANASSHERLEVVALAPTVAVPVGGPTQPLAGGAVAALVRVPAFGIAPAAAVAATDHVAVTERSFTNSLVSVSWDLDGSITSIIDVRAGREVLPPGRSVRVELAPDRPVEYDAWDVEQWTRGLGLPLIGADSVEVIDAGPLVATLEVRRRFGRSSLVQRLTVRSGSARLDLAFHIDWKEDEQLLSLLVPLDVHAREAACDVQFGHVMRPTHASTSWDAAKFEVCAHRYVDLSEPGFGVAVLNDGRYGHSVQEPGPGGGHGVRVSLLRAAKFPDPSQDHGTHDVTIAILPHGPGLHDVLRAAAALNEPLRVVAPGVAGTAPQPVVTVTGAGVGVSAVKRADDGSGDLIVRLHEACGARTEVGVRTQWRAIEATRCNLLEEPQQGLETGDGIATLMLRPFELVTLRLSRVVR
jgi:alpha-mannosidase